MPKPNLLALPYYTQNTNPAPQVYTDQRLSIVSIVCRICYDTEKDEPLITPCRCKGTVAFVHRSCLETWLAESNTSTCELCHQMFRTERTPKYSSLKSIWKWIRVSPGNQRGARGVKSDLLACGLLTPVAILITYVCLFSSDYYNQKKFATIPAARWTSISLLFMIAIMLIGYYLWVYSVIRLHARMWYNWWQRECTVKYVPPSTVNICPSCPSRSNPPNNTPLSRVESAEDVLEQSETRQQPRVQSVFQVEGEETEIYHEALDRVTEKKQKACSSSAPSEYSMINMSQKCEEEAEAEEEEEKQTHAKNSFSLIKNEGVVYIINITRPDSGEDSSQNLEHESSNASTSNLNISNLDLDSSEEVSDLSNSKHNVPEVEFGNQAVSLTIMPKESSRFTIKNEVVSSNVSTNKSNENIGEAPGENASNHQADKNGKMQFERPKQDESDVSSDESEDTLI